jgi:hypothetical protein
MRFNLRRLMVWVTIVAVLLGLFRRVIIELVPNLFHMGLLKSFLTPLQVYPWLFNIDFKTYQGYEGTPTFPEFMCLCLGGAVTIVSGIMGICLLVNLAGKALAWADKK